MTNVFVINKLCLILQVVECVAESLSILETPLQVKVSFNSTVSTFLARTLMWLGTLEFCVKISQVQFLNLSVTI